MKSLTEYLWFEVPGRRGFINFTRKIEELVSQSGVREGLCLVNMHTSPRRFSSTTTRAGSITRPVLGALPGEGRSWRMSRAMRLRRPGQPKT